MRFQSRFGGGGISTKDGEGRDSTGFALLSGQKLDTIM